jgi:hypothetical protein
VKAVSEGRDLVRPFELRVVVNMCGLGSEDGGDEAMCHSVHRSVLRDDQLVKRDGPLPRQMTLPGR